MLYPYLPGVRQLKRGDIRGFATQEQAASAAQGTTYVCAYRGMEYNKAMKDRETYEWVSKKPFQLFNALCPAFRADEAMLTETKTKVIRFRTCGAMAVVNDEGHLKCYECLYEQEEAKEHMKAYGTNNLS